MLTLELQLLPRSADFDVVIVVDILRMTTTSSVLMDRGLAELYVVAHDAEARQMAREKTALLLGERGGLPLPGFDGGNSPLEYVHQNLSGKKAVVCTSNGSKAVEIAYGAKHILLGSIVNAETVASEAVRRATTGITIICAGTAGQVSLDDALGAGIICEEIEKVTPVTVKGDEALLVARAIQNLPSDHLANELKQAHHGQLVIDLGFEEDIHFAARRNSIRTVAVKKESFFVGVKG
jgi:2-phosphosulfolactate phosphatase